MGSGSGTTGGDGNYLFYLAIPPSLFGRVTDRLSEVGLLHESEERRRENDELATHADAEDRKPADQVRDQIRGAGHRRRVSGAVG